MMIDGNLLTTLIERYQYRPVADQLLIFAIRGALPNEALNGRFEKITTFRTAHSVTPVKINYKTSRCTVGLWDSKQNKVALFPGSTLPCKTYLSTHTSRLADFNILCPGSYELRRGIHPRNAGCQPHDALLMDGYGLVKKPGARSVQNDIRFDWTTVSYAVKRAGDNLHAARIEPAVEPSAATACLFTLHAAYSSSGCITIIGNPSQYSAALHSTDAWNCWQKFITYIQRSDNETPYRFLLFDAADLNKKQDLSERIIRYGSYGEDVNRMQRALACIVNGKDRQTYYRGVADGAFTGETVKAYLQFQTDFSGCKTEVRISVQDFFNSIKHFQFS